MARVHALPLVLSLAFACSACKSAPKEAPVPSTGDASGEEKIRFRTGADDAPSSEGPGVGAYVAAPFENVLWWPWKIVGTGVKGAADGVASGFQKDRMPVLGLLFSPLTGAAGLVTGFFEGVAMGPGLVGPSDNFGHVMSLPPKHATTIWWYK
jgi:hypothetical protein